MPPSYTGLLTFFANNNVDCLMNPHIPHRHMVPRTSLICESEVSIKALCLLCSSRYTAVQIKNCLKVHLVINVASMKNTMVPCAPAIVWNWTNWTIHCPSLSAVFNLLHSSMNQELLEKNFSNQGSHYEKYGRFLVTQRKPSYATTKLTLFTVSKDTRRTLVSPRRMHWASCSMPKGTSRAEVTSNSEKSNP